MSINQISSLGINFKLTKQNNYNNAENKSGDLQVTPLACDTVSKNIITVSGIARENDVTNISPRGMANMSQSLYDTGNISLKNHAFLSFQPELNPDYNATIGQMTNTIGQPDVPRDFLGEWKDRLKEQLKGGLSGEITQNTKEVVSILENLEALRGSLYSNGG